MLIIWTQVLTYISIYSHLMSWNGNKLNLLISHLSNLVAPTCDFLWKINAIIPILLVTQHKKSMRITSNIIPTIEIVMIVNEDIVMRSSSVSSLFSSRSQ